MIDFKGNDALGRVLKVNTTTVTVKANNEDHLRHARVNRLVMLESRPGERLVGLIRKVSRIQIPIESGDISEFASAPQTENLVDVSLVGTHFERREDKSNYFVRALAIVPEIDALCFPLEGGNLATFMRGISAGNRQKLHLGAYALDETTDAYLDGNRLLQRHAAIVGSTGSGKSWTVARIVEQAESLPNANAILFDIHGEYKSLADGKNVCRYKIAGPSDIDTDKNIKDGTLFLPFWLLDYPAIVSMFVDRSDQNAPNQAMVMSREIVNAKRKWLEDNSQHEILTNFTIDSPVPFSHKTILEKLRELNKEMVDGTKSKKQGDFHGKLSRLIQRLEAKSSDRRLGFMFQSGEKSSELKWLDGVVKALMEGTKGHPKHQGVKIIDFSGVPSDILPLVVSLVARMVFQVQQWTPSGTGRHPVALFCDEAHLYIPNRDDSNATSAVSIDIFERIAKEGRKYGIGLVVISQRPADVNRTVLSQCNNFIAMRLTNAEDQSVIRRLFPDDLGDFASDLPVLETGEALVVGDASILPTRVKVAEPKYKPISATVDFWNEWRDSETTDQTTQAVDNWRKQTLPPDED